MVDSLFIWYFAVFQIKMPRTYRSKLELSDEEKKNRRREQKKMSMRRARKKLNETAKEEIRKMDRERYHRKKERGEIKTIDQYTPRKQRQEEKCGEKNLENAVSF